MADDAITAAEVNRRVNGLEPRISQGFAEIKQEFAEFRNELRSQYVHQLQYDADKRAMQDDIAELRNRLASLIQRIWWLAATIAGLAVSVVGLFIR